MKNEPVLCKQLKNQSKEIHKWEDLFEVNVKDLQPGEYGWTVPWAVWCDMAGEFWVNPDYTLCSMPGGTVDARILCVAPNKYALDVTRSTYKWSKQAKACYVGHDGNDWGSVTITSFGSTITKQGTCFTRLWDKVRNVFDRSRMVKTA